MVENQTESKAGAIENGVNHDSDVHDEGKASNKKWRKGSKVGSEDGESKQKTKASLVSMISLFRYATKLDQLFMLIGTLSALGHGALMPLMILVFGELLDSFTDRVSEFCTLDLESLANKSCPPGYVLTTDNFLTSFSICNFSSLNITVTDFSSQVNTQTIYLFSIGALVVVLGYLQIAFWSMAGERQTKAIRKALFRSIIHKEIVYFDTHKTGDLNNKLTDDINKIHDGIGDKIGSATQFTSSFFTGLIVGFIKGWKLTLVVLSLSPLLFASAVLFSKLATNLQQMELKAYGKAGAVAEEVFSAIRTVLCYNGQQREQNRYEEHLNTARSSGVKKGAINGFTMGLVWFLVFIAYALGFWYGAKLIREENFSIGGVIIVFFDILIAVFNLGQAGPHFQALNQARGAAFGVWEIIDHPSKIDVQSESGTKKDGIQGDIAFRNVCFTYPSRPGVQILDNITLSAKRGQTVALVGSSGCGKSTCVQLLQRFYDPDQGTVTIDETRVSDYNLKWLRQHIGVVSQEPILFQESIRENIRFGRDSATDEEIIQAAKMANAHDFIMGFPDKYDTPVGERGATLSGGQKQRIAIARALVRNPKILLLDEATSALDNESEKIVQDALEKASKGRTTLVIAHRLSTIRYADKIIVMENGRVIEEGDHESLMQAHGKYFALVEQQNLRLAEEQERLALEEKEIEARTSDSRVQSKLSLNRPRSSTAVSITPSANGEPDVMQNGDAHEINDKTKKKKEKKPNVAWIMMKMNSPELIFIIIGCFACIINGGIQPSFGVILSKLTAVFQECDPAVQERRVLLYILLFIGFAIINLIATFLQGLLFAISGEALTKRLRSQAFEATLRQDIAYFDDPKNNTGALCARLATEASAVQGATGIRIGLTLQNFASLGVGIIISFVFSWQLTLLVLGFVPFMVVGGFLQSKLMTGFGDKDKSTMEGVGKIAVEAIQNIRTVAQLTKENYFYEQYCVLIEVPYKIALKRAHLQGFAFSITNAVVYFCLGALFQLGAFLVQRNQISFEDLLLVFNCIIFGAQNVGQTASMAPDYKKAVIAAESILELLNRKPAIDNSSTEGKTITNLSGKLEFNSVSFFYPSRPESTVLKNFDLKIEPGQQIALVGSSGCGKSTTIQLIERFYDPTDGNLFIDSVDIRDLNLQWYRSQIGLVSQEPVLFDMSIRENIAYGDNNRDNISMDEIIAVAKAANVHQFIQSLPDGYDTNCGMKGTQLSGGQKQRIAIARALIRNPKVLLLDEATSALDTESEKVVQDALDSAQKGRTSITIAHRLSTIQNADKICVLHKGVIVESGTHSELLALGGRYYRLAMGKLRET